MRINSLNCWCPMLFSITSIISFSTKETIRYNINNYMDYPGTQIHHSQLSVWLSKLILIQICIAIALFSREECQFLWQSRFSLFVNVSSFLITDRYILFDIRLYLCFGSEKCIQNLNLIWINKIQKNFFLCKLYSLSVGIMED